MSSWWHGKQYDTRGTKNIINHLYRSGDRSAFMCPPPPVRLETHPQANKPRLEGGVIGRMVHGALEQGVKGPAVAKVEENRDPMMTPKYCKAGAHFPRSNGRHVIHAPHGRIQYSNRITKGRVLPPGRLVCRRNLDVSIRPDPQSMCSVPGRLQGIARQRGAP